MNPNPTIKPDKIQIEAGRAPVFSQPQTCRGGHLPCRSSSVGRSVSTLIRADTEVGPCFAGRDFDRPVLSKVEGPVLSKVEGPVLSKVEGPVLSKVEGLSRAKAPLKWFE